MLIGELLDSFGVNQMWQLIQGDCMEVMKTFKENSIDVIITDPPYNLSFMGKQWDTIENYQEWCMEWGKEALRILKPGGFLLAFGGTRTYHRLTCGLEDAGFEIRDCLMWVYGSGFPKSMDISKAIDKELGAKREAIGIDEYRAKRLPNGRTRNNTNVYGIDKRAGEDFKITAPVTPEAQQWQGWGTALKPAYEPIIMARKPISEKNVATNVLKWGTGGINIDGCRIGTDIMITRGRTDNHSTRAINKGFSGNIDKTPKVGRWPANLLLDEEAAKLLDQQSGIKKSGVAVRHKSGGKNFGSNTPKPPLNDMGYGDIGGASRFFYVAKASTKERTMNGKVVNNHPTVKPIKLMQYLCRLITPPGGTILDPFAGSGSTLVAAMLEGFNVIGIEKDKENYNIAFARCNVLERDLEGDFMLREPHNRAYLREQRQRIISKRKRIIEQV